jgi:predicted dehydrogenase
MMTKPTACSHGPSALLMLLNRSSLRVNVAMMLTLVFLSLSCRTKETDIPAKPNIHLITLEPGHFHAALVQKKMYDDIDSIVHVYSTGGYDLKLHLGRIETFNSRAEDPTTWNEQVITTEDPLKQMLEDKPGNVVVLSGNNQKKTEYIARSIEGGLHVLADKPMVISSEGFQQLKNVFKTAKKSDRILYDIMTERFEITTILQRELSQIADVFGSLEKGSPENPSVTKESVHHFHKNVAGSILTRPAWFMDTEQQGEGIVDVTTHLVDLVQWEAFPEQSLDTSDVKILSAKRWTTSMTRSQFKAITKLDEFPDYLTKNRVNDSTIEVYSNGEINYTLRGVHAKVSVIWAYKAKEGAGDTHYSIMRGSKANLVIRQGEEQNFKPTLYIEPISNSDKYSKALTEKFLNLANQYPGIDLKKVSTGWEVVIPDTYKEGHEAHFGRVMENFITYLRDRKLPDWEVPNMITKYYTTTKALDLARSNK